MNQTRKQINRPAGPANVVKGVLRSYALRVEYIASYINLLMVVCFNYRYVTTELPQIVSTTIPLVVLANSAFVAFEALLFIYLFHKNGVPAVWLTFSVLSDAVYFHISMAMNVVTQGEEYQGILYFPEMFILLLIVFAIGFRFSFRLALIGFAMNFACFLALVALDNVITPTSRMRYGSDEIAIWCAMILMAGAAMIMVIMIVYRLALVIAREMRELEAMRGSALDLVAAHHDSGSVVTSLRQSLVQLERLNRKPGSTELARVQLALEKDVDAIQKMLCNVRRRGKGIAVVDTEVEAVSVDDALRRCKCTLAHRYPGIRLLVRKTVQGQLVWLAGGELGFIRMLDNLLKNACAYAASGNAITLVTVVESSKRDCTLTFQEIFKPRAAPAEDAETTTGINGWGVGMLSLSRIAANSGGSASYCVDGFGAFKIAIRLPLVGGAPSETRYETA